MATLLQSLRVCDKGIDALNLSMAATNALPEPDEAADASWQAWGLIEVNTTGQLADLAADLGDQNDAEHYREMQREKVRQWLRVVVKS